MLRVCRVSIQRLQGGSSAHTALELSSLVVGHLQCRRKSAWMRITADKLFTAAFVCDPPDLGSVDSNESEELVVSLFML